VKTDWPERISPQLRSQLAAIDPFELRSWKATFSMPSVGWLVQHYFISVVSLVRTSRNVADFQPR
jgi:hypothetical protein